MNGGSEPSRLERQLFKKHHWKRRLSKQHGSIETNNGIQRNDEESIGQNEVVSGSQTHKSRDALVSMLDKMNRRSSDPLIRAGRNAFEVPHLYRKNCQVFPAERIREVYLQHDRGENLQIDEHKRNEGMSAIRIRRRHSVQDGEKRQIKSYNSNAFTRGLDDKKYSATRSGTDTNTIITKIPDYAVKREKVDTLILMHQCHKEKSEANGCTSLFEKRSKETRDRNKEHMQTINGRYVRDYVSVAMKYARLSKYKNNCVQENAKCIRCLSRAPSRQKSNEHNIKAFPNFSKVFYPCEHRCICDQCFQDKKWDTCPWCHEQVKLILDKTGMETDEYWSWINEVKPPLPLKFQKHFLRLSRQRISEAMALSIEETCFSDESTRSCNRSFGSEQNHLQASKICTIL